MFVLYLLHQLLNAFKKQLFFYFTDYSYRHFHHSPHNYDYHYTDRKSHHSPRPYLPDYRRPSQPFDHRSYEPYLPPTKDFEQPIHRYYYNRERDRDYWGFPQYGRRRSYEGDYDYYRNRNKSGTSNYYLPPKTGSVKDWGLYGGSYGTGGSSGGHDYWGLKAHGGNGRGYYNYGETPPYAHRPSYRGRSYLPAYYGYFDGGPESKYPGSNYVKDGKSENCGFGNGFSLFVVSECSLRMATGSKLRKVIVKRLYGVPNIYECEYLCFKERDFPCASYAYR